LLLDEHLFDRVTIGRAMAALFKAARFENGNQPRG
jgi:hypothetical protein